MSIKSIFEGSWTYRSFLNDPAVPPDSETCMPYFGNGVINIQEAPADILRGTIGGSGWSLDLYGSRSYGNPMTVRFQGKGIISGSAWIYDYVGYLVPEWPNGKQQIAAMVGSIVRAIPHPDGKGGTSPAGVVASWYAVRQDAPKK